MGIINEFSEGATSMCSDTEELEPASLPVSEDFLTIFQAVLHNLEVAENVFARVAKKRFRWHVGDISKNSVEDVEDLWPKWVSEMAVVIRVTPDEAEAKSSSWCESLLTLTDNMAAAVKEASMGKELVVPTALGVRIQVVGENTFKFVLKQKWATQ